MPLYVVSSGATLPASTFNGVAAQVNIVCTSSTRPSSPPTGMVIYETDTDAFRYWNGTTWFITGGKSQFAIASGSVTITPSAVDTPTSATVTFPSGRFITAPNSIQVSVNTAYPGPQPGGVVNGCSFSNPSASSMTVWVNRHDLTPTSVNWLAVNTP